MAWYRDGLCFECTQCGSCCTGFEGYVWVDQAKIAELAEFLQMKPDDFSAQYVRKVGRRLSLIEKKNLDCIFWEDGKGCTVYPVRPTQCRTFPFWRENLRSRGSWAEVTQECPGANNGRHYDAAEINRLARGHGETGARPSDDQSGDAQ
ncbi:MAG: YkgJ family cysteine cluster protein [Planctomycetota bacterium]